jgi:hypothetical protein
MPVNVSNANSDSALKEEINIEAGLKENAIALMYARASFPWYTF